jgi:hydrogenase maturation protease
LVDYLVVGVGNTLREDDGAGVVLAEHLHGELSRRGVRTQVRLVPQMLPELAAEIAELAPAILLITDCAVGDDLARLQPLLPAQTFAAGSHGLGAAQLLALAVRLYEFGGSAWMATVPGFNFAHGEGLSAGAMQAIDDCLPWMVAQLLAISPVQDS